MWRTAIHSVRIIAAIGSMIVGSTCGVVVSTSALAATDWSAQVLPSQASAPLGTAHRRAPDPDDATNAFVRAINHSRYRVARRYATASLVNRWKLKHRNGYRLTSVDSCEYGYDLAGWGCGPSALLRRGDVVGYVDFFVPDRLPRRLTRATLIRG
jgi:hypothetical protein